MVGYKFFRPAASGTDVGVATVDDWVIDAEHTRRIGPNNAPFTIVVWTDY